MTVSGVSPSMALGTGPSGTQKPAKPGEPFARVLTDLLQGANRHQLEADKAVEDLALGRTNDLHKAVLAVAKADLTFRLVLEVRNRLVEAYQEVMRMQV